MHDTLNGRLARYSMRSWAVALLLVLGLYDIAYIAQWSLGSPQPPFGDFFGFWSFGRFGRAFGGAIYDPAALARYQHTLLASLQGNFPFPYPPSFLLAVVPLGFLPLQSAYLVWMAAGLLAYAGATLGRQWRSAYGLALLVAPTTVLTITSGQNGFLTAALLVGGLNSLRNRPVLAGVLFGCLTYKPQFALLVPIFLLASGRRVAVLTFCLTIAALVLITSLAFGWSVWPRWIAGFPAYQHLLKANQTRLDHLMPTVLAGIHVLGGPALIGYVLQSVLSLAAAALCWRALSSGISDRAIALSIVCALLVPPYEMIYDTPMLASAVALDWRSRIRSGTVMGLREITLIIALFECLSSMVSYSLPLVAPTLMLVVLVGMARST